MVQEFSKQQLAAMMHVVEFEAPPPGSFKELP